MVGVLNRLYTLERNFMDFEKYNYLVGSNYFEYFKILP